MAESKSDGFQSKKPEDSDFQQQRLKAWQPLLTPIWVIFTFLLVGVVFIIIGVVVLQASNSVVEVTVRYDNISTQGSRIAVRLPIPADMKPPIFLYYKLTNFYQNHRRYVKSRSDAQLKGESGALDSCDPLVTFATPGGPRNLYPCGLIANSFFNDTFATATIARANGGAAEPMNWTGQGISWESDRRAKFVVNNDWLNDTRHTTVGPGGQLPRVDNEDFIVWMRTAGLPTFKKLNKRILADNMALKAGDVLIVDVTNNFPVAEFEGEKALVLSTTSWLGGKNEFLGYAYIVVGAMSVALALAFFIKHKVSPRELGQMKYFNLPCAPKK